MEVRLFADLAERAGGNRLTVEVGEEATVESVLESVFAEYPSLESRVRTDDGRLHPSINVLHNGSDVRTEPDALQTPVSDDDELALFPPVSGG